MLLSEVDKKFKEAFVNLSDVGRYIALMEMWRDDSKIKEFRRLYEEFYKLNLRRFPDTFKNKYFEYMQTANKNKDNKELTLEQVLKTLRSFQRELKIKETVEASFASKLLHTIRPNDFPTWDEWIGKNATILDGFVDLSIPSSRKDKDEQCDEADKRYKDLTNWFKKYIDSVEGKMVLDLFDQYYPKFKDKLSPIKKIDLVLWQWHRERDKQT